MKRLIFLLLIPIFLFAQEKKEIEPNILVGFNKFVFNGDFEINTGGLAFGLHYPGIKVEPGIYLYSLIFDNESTDHAEVSLDAIIHIGIFQKFGAGAGIKFWQSGIGFPSSFGNEKFYLTLTYNVEI